MKTTTIGTHTKGGMREALQAELAKRCRENQQYSLRAFAKSLGIDHSTLSQILRRKRNLTEDMIRELAQSLQLDKVTTDRFVIHEARSTTRALPQNHVKQLEAEAFEVISQWYHFAILELIRLPSFRSDSRWIARVLDITVDEINLALTRLLHLGMLSMLDVNNWVDHSLNARASIESRPDRIALEVAQRLQSIIGANGRNEFAASSTTMAIDRSRIPIVFEYLETVRETIQTIASSNRCDDVFSLDMFFYPLTNLNEGRR